MAEVGLLASPMTFVIVTGGIDLSVGSIFGLLRHPARCAVAAILAFRCTIAMVLRRD